jgi:hypothetical protein
LNFYPSLQDRLLQLSFLPADDYPDTYFEIMK